MRISDWSSDVCSSDLITSTPHRLTRGSHGRCDARLDRRRKPHRRRLRRIGWMVRRARLVADPTRRRALLGHDTMSRDELSPISKGGDIYPATADVANRPPPTPPERKDAASGKRGSVQVKPR